MFEFMLRKTMLRKLRKNDQNLMMLLKECIKSESKAKLILNLFSVLPFLIMMYHGFTSKNTIANIMISSCMNLGYLIFVIWFRIKFYQPIQKFEKLIAGILYSSDYVLKGKAISRKDFENIKKKNKDLYEYIVNLKTQGYCYSTCFDILKTLQKGKIRFIAVKNFEKDSKINAYTMHVIFVNNGWCYDTFSMRQYELNEYMKGLDSKTYKDFLYKDIKGKNYKKFMDEEYLELYSWCKDNDCFTRLKEN